MTKLDTNKNKLDSVKEISYRDEVLVPRYCGHHQKWHVEILEYELIFKVPDGNDVKSPRDWPAFDMVFTPSPCSKAHGVNHESLSTALECPAPAKSGDEIRCGSAAGCFDAAKAKAAEGMWLDTFITRRSIDRFIHENRNGQDADPDLAEVVHRTAIKIGWWPSKIEWKPVENKRKYYYDLHHPTTRKVVQITLMELTDYFEDGAPLYAVDGDYEKQRSFRDWDEASEYARKLSERYGVSIYRNSC